MKKNYARILMLARLTRWLSIGALVVGTMSWILWSSMLFGGQTGFAVGGFHFGLRPSYPIGSGSQVLDPLLVWIASTLGLAVTAFGLVRLVELMGIYASGVVFDRRASQLLSSFAAAILLRELIDIAALPLLALVTHTNSGQPPLNFHIGSTQAHVLFIALIFVLISRIMAAGHQLADDNAKII